MAGSGVQKRQRALAIRAYQLRKNGLTNRQIAELVGRQVQQIPKLIEYGERFAQTQPGDSHGN